MEMRCAPFHPNVDQEGPEDTGNRRRKQRASNPIEFGASKQRGERSQNGNKAEDERQDSK